MKSFLEQENIFEYRGILNISESSPMFPIDGGWEIALFSLASYPIGMPLYPYDIMGRIAVFFSNTKLDLMKDRWHKKLLHTAVYGEDLIELVELGLVSGVNIVTEYKYRLNEFNEMLKYGFSTNEQGDIIFYTKDANSELKEHIFTRPKLENYIPELLDNELNKDKRQELISEYKWLCSHWIEINNYLVITEKGKNKINELSENISIPNEILKLINPLINIQYFDTAVRDISVFFESEIKKFHNTNLFGERLIEHHISKCVEVNDGNFYAGLKIYRQELRTMNRFIRNEFMHNKFKLSEGNYRTILYRQCNLYTMMNQAFQRLKHR